jgi:hypothetical protein
MEQRVLALQLGVFWLGVAFNGELQCYCFKISTYSIALLGFLLPLV